MGESMKRTVTYTITVNDLAIALARHYRLRDVQIESVEAANLSAQRHPPAIEIGVGGVCTLTFSANPQTWRKK